MIHNPREIWIDGKHYDSIAIAAEKENLNKNVISTLIYQHKGQTEFMYKGRKIRPGPAQNIPANRKAKPAAPKAPPAPALPPELSDSETADLVAQLEGLRKDFRSLQVALLKTKGQLRTMAAEIGNLKEALVDRESA